MPDPNQPGDLPLRPLTTGELLDAAVVLLRSRGRVLIVSSALLAVVEQLSLFPVRRIVPAEQVTFVAVGALPELTVPAFYIGGVVVFGLFTEVLCIALLAGVAARGAARALLGAAAPPGMANPPAIVVAAIVTALGSAATAWTFLVFPPQIGWVAPYLITALIFPLGYGLLGLTVPATVIDQVNAGTAPFRSLALAGRNGMRAAWILVVGYLVWLVVRLTVVIGITAVGQIFHESTAKLSGRIITAAAFALVNTLAYAVLGCLAVAVHLDTRMRVEGLDIALRRDLKRSGGRQAVLTVSR